MSEGGNDDEKGVYWPLARPQVVCTSVMTWGVPMWFTTNGIGKGAGGGLWSETLHGLPFTSFD